MTTPELIEALIWIAAFVIGGLIIGAIVDGMEKGNKE